MKTFVAAWLMMVTMGAGSLRLHRHLHIEELINGKKNDVMPLVVYNLFEQMASSFP